MKEKIRKIEIIDNNKKNEWKWNLTYLDFVIIIRNRKKLKGGKNGRIDHFREGRIKKIDKSK